MFKGSTNSQIKSPKQEYLKCNPTFFFSNKGKPKGLRNQIQKKDQHLWN